MEQKQSFGTRFRPLRGPVRVLHEALLLSLAILGAVWSLEIHSDLGIVIFKEQFLALIFTIAMVALFLAAPARPADSGSRVPWYDWILIALSLAAGGFVVGYFHVIRDDIGLESPARWGLGTIAVLLVLEATRRVAGWALIVLALALMFYARFADFFPGFLNAPSENWTTLARYMYLDNNALFGFPLSVTVSMIIAFIMFGRMLYAVNGDKVLTDFAMAVMGRTRCHR